MKLKPISVAISLSFGFCLSSSAQATELALAKSSHEATQAIPATQISPRIREGMDDPRLLCELAKLYYTGQGVEQNIKRAFDLYTASAKKGWAEAQYLLAMIYVEGNNPTNVASEDDLAMYWLSKAAEQGYEPASFAYDYMINHNPIDGC